MGRQSGTGIDGGLQGVAVEVGVAHGDRHPRGDAFFGEGDGTLFFRGDRHQPDPSAGRFLEALEFIPVGRADVLELMRAAWAIDWGDVWPFQMQTGNGGRGVRIFVERPGAVGEGGFHIGTGAGGDSGHPPADTAFAHQSGNPGQRVPLFGRGDAAGPAGIAVDLDIEKSGADAQVGRLL